MKIEDPILHSSWDALGTGMGRVSYKGDFKTPSMLPIFWSWSAPSVNWCTSEVALTCAQDAHILMQPECSGSLAQPAPTAHPCHALYAGCCKREKCMLFVKPLMPARVFQWRESHCFYAPFMAPEWGKGDLGQERTGPGNLIHPCLGSPLQLCKMSLKHY